jgi:uncharacterized membrane protein YfcA
LNFIFNLCYYPHHSKSLLTILGYILCVLIGISLGLIGGGGSILTVPLLVYMFQVDPVTATTYSLFIVGLTSLVGGAKAYINGYVDFRAISLFGIPSILSIFIARHFILPAIPEHIFSIGNLQVSRGVLFMLIFAFLMVTASVFMIRTHEEKIVEKLEHRRQLSNLALALPGLVVGLVTGLLGAGGGFLIIPALVLIIKIPMKIAVGTSLLIIAINSGFGFLFSIGHYYFDWPLLLIFAALAVAGVFIGLRIGRNIPGDSLRKGFGWFVLCMGIAILIKELFV